MRIAMALLFVSLAFGPGCGKKKGADGDQGSAGSAMTGSDTAGSAAAGSDSGSAAAGSGSAGSAAAGDTLMAKKGGNCPSTVFTSTTKAELEDGKIRVTVTSDDKDAVAAIQKRAEELLKQKADGVVGAAHDQKGTHGGAMGLCPIYLGDGGTATATNEAKGVTVTITPKDKVDILKGEIDSRILKAADWVKANYKEGDKGSMGGTGGGSANDGMNHSGMGDGKGMERKAAGSGEPPKGDGKGGGKGSGGGGGGGTGGGGGSGGSGMGSAKTK
jgi:hypothetical protein